MALFRRLAQNGPPAGFQRPSGATGPPPGFSPPAGMTGPPPGLFGPSTPSDAATATMTGPSISSIVSSSFTGIPAGFTVPAGATGPPPGFTPPPDMSGPPSGIAPHGGIRPPNPMDLSDLDTIIGVTTMLLVLCLVAVGGRLMSRRIVKQRLCADDFLAVGALLLFFGLCIIQYLRAYYGTEKGMASNAAFAIPGMLSFSSQLIYNFVVTTARLSILFLYKRVFNLRARWFRIAWWSCMGIVSLYCIALLILNLTSCAPHLPSAMWQNRRVCRFRKSSPVSMGFLNAAIDLTILILPIRMTWDLQMAKKQKIAISSVFALGTIGVAVSIARAVSLASPNLFTQGVLIFALWSTTEPAVILICACLPVMRPLLISITKIIPSSSSWASWSWSSRPGKAKSSVDTNSSKTLTSNSSSNRGLGKDSRGGSFGKALYSKELRGDGFKKQGYTKVESKIEAREIKSPLPAYSPGSKRLNNHIGNYAEVARDKGLAMQDLRKPGSSEDKEGLSSTERACSKCHVCERCQGELKGGWE